MLLQWLRKLADSFRGLRNTLVQSGRGNARGRGRRAHFRPNLTILEDRVTPSVDLWTGASPTLGHTNGLYSIATGNVGNAQPTPTAARASTLVVGQAVTTMTSLASDHPMGSTYGELVTFTARVNSNDGTPTGSVQFQIDGANYGSPVPLTAGAASTSTTALSASPHAILAFYISDSSGFINSDNHTNPGSQTVHPAPLTITADNLTLVFGEPVPPLTAHYSGFVNSDTAAVLSGAPSLNTTAAPGSAAGNYPILVGPGSLASTNYTFRFVNGTLTYTPPPAPIFNFGPLFAASLSQALFAASLSQAKPRLAFFMQQVLDVAFANNGGTSDAARGQLTFWLAMAGTQSPQEAWMLAFDELSLGMDLALGAVPPVGPPMQMSSVEGLKAAIINNPLYSTADGFELGLWAEAAGLVTM